jgi:hypothetical protein
MESGYSIDREAQQLEGFSALAKFWFPVPMTTTVSIDIRKVIDESGNKVEHPRIGCTVSG